MGHWIPTHKITQVMTNTDRVVKDLIWPSLWMTSGFAQQTFKLLRAWSDKQQGHERREEQPFIEFLWSLPRHTTCSRRTEPTQMMDPTIQKSAYVFQSMKVLHFERPAAEGCRRTKYEMNGYYIIELLKCPQHGRRSCLQRSIKSCR